MLSCLSSCANYIKNIHSQIDYEERKRSGNIRPPSAAQKQGYRRGDARPIQNPVTLGEASTRNTSNYYPNVRRQYQDDPNYRYKASDLLDNDNSGSLWNGTHGDNFLFVTNNIKKEGDFVIVDVRKKLKENITEELKRHFPERPTKKSKKEDEKKTDKEEPQVAKAASDKPDKVYDKIPTKVIERINSDYLLLRGRKEVLFQKQKRYIQFQGIVSSKNITDSDSVSSDKLLEPQITVLRY